MSAVTLEHSRIILYSVTARLASGSLTGEPVIFFLAAVWSECGIRHRCSVETLSREKVEYVVAAT